MGATDSKLAFKKGVFRLFEERNIPSSANDYWEQFWILPESAEDVFLLVGSQDIRRVRDEARENLECLLEKTLAHLFRLVESPQFLGPQAPASQVLNCIRILTRLFPFIFESDELMDWEERYFWTPRSVVVSSKRKITSTLPALSVSTMARSNQQDAITPIEALNDQTTSFAGQKEEFLELEEKSVPSYGQRLILTLQNLLFTSGFTLPAALEPKSRVTFVIWETGIGSSKPIGTTKELDDNRAEVLRLLLVLFSRSMYIAPAAITTTENRWIDTVVTSTDRQATLAILCSLINSALKYNPSGWGLPYNHVMFSDQRDLLVMLSLQVVVVLLDYQVVERPTSVYHPDVRVDSASHGVTSYSSPPPQLQRSMSLEPGNKNQFRYYLSRLHREQDFQFLIDGMYRILSNPMTASSTYLPGSTKHVKYHHETLILCWKTLELNKRFRTYLLETNRVLDILVILLYFCMEYKQDPTHIGLLRMCAFMLQTLSKDKAFGKSLNKVFDGHASLPANVRIHNFHGTYGDYLICTVHHLIATTKRALRSLYPALISTLANVSPHLKNISPLASSRLMQLTTSFASPSFLLAEESNHGLLGSLLDTVCSILYYQASDNPHLIYALVQYEPKIQTMATFTLQRGLADIHSLRYHHADNSHTAVAPSKQSDPPPRRASQQRQATGNSQHRLSPVRRESTLTLDPLSRPDATSDSSVIPLKTQSEEQNGNKSSSRIEAPVLARPISSDSIMAASDGGGHDGDVEDEGGPSTVMRGSRTERTPHVLSEKARGKLPEGHRAPPFTREPSSDIDQQAIDFASSKKEHTSTAGGSKLGSRSSSTILGPGVDGKSQQEQETTAKDVGQNGFIPTAEWVAGWMKTLRFEPLLAMLRHVLPELEQVQAMNDQQVLEYIRTNIALMLEQVLPESGRPPIYTRRFVWSELLVWFQGLMWSHIYIGGGGRLGRQGLGAWHETGVRLFSIRTLPTASAAVTVSDNVASVAAAAMRVAGSTFASSSSSASALLSSPATSRTSTSSSRPEPPRRSSTGVLNSSSRNRS
ncbi:MAG: high-temperature-induced dauer-formation protein-domain-containing protein [Podila humilis]|nr:MAG: high-temperature-induced dauer-formation protein-domain-containing protein [Podila humilis]